MNICFYANGHKSGLDCNGGTRTIIKSAEALRELGHRVDIVASYDRYTWGDHPKCLPKVPKDTDAIVAVSVTDVADVWKMDIEKKFWWMRGIETWKLPVNKIIKRARAVKTIVNARHLKDWLGESDIDSQLCYAGLDQWKDYGLPHINGHTTIGCLYNDFHDKGWETFKKLVKYLGTQKYSYFAFGAKKYSAPWLTRYVHAPSKKDLISLYNTCDVWLCDTKNEGFFNVGAEAALSGCLLYTNRLPHNGTGDYADDETAMVYDSFEELVEKIKKPDYSKISKCQKGLCEIGSREKNMTKFVELLGG